MSVVSDLGFKFNLFLVINAKSTEHMFHRRGIGRMKNNGVGVLVASGRRLNAQAQLDVR